MKEPGEQQENCIIKIKKIDSRIQTIGKSIPSNKAKAVQIVNMFQQHVQFLFGKMFEINSYEKLYTHIINTQSYVKELIEEEVDLFPEVNPNQQGQLMQDIDHNIMALFELNDSSQHRYSKQFNNLAALIEKYNTFLGVRRSIIENIKLMIKAKDEYKDLYVPLHASF